MQEMDVLQILSRWLHVGSAIVMVGGIVFWRYAVLPAVVRVSGSDQGALQEEVAGRWKYFVHVPITLLVLSGIYNVIVRFQGNSPVVAWHMLATVKILVALFIMFIASALVGRSRALAPMRQNPVFWMNMIDVLAAVVVLISVILTRLPDAS